MGVTLRVAGPGGAGAESPRTHYAPDAGSSNDSLVAECVEGAEAQHPYADGQQGEGGEQCQHIRTTHGCALDGG